MLALLVTVGACFGDNGTLPNTLASNLVGWEALSKWKTHTLHGLTGYLTFYALYSEEETIVEIDDRKWQGVRIAYVRLPGGSTPVNVNIGADMTAAYVRIPYPISCHTIQLLGVEYQEEAAGFRLNTGGQDHDVAVCFLPLTYSESDTMTISMKADGPEYLAQVFDANGRGGEVCEKSKCKFKGLRRGNMIVTLMSRLGSTVEVTKPNPSAIYATHDICTALVISYPNDGTGSVYQLSSSETTWGNSGGAQFYGVGDWCTWIPWWSILLMLLACLIGVGSIVGGIMCCYCGICTCCGCCTCWVKKEEGEMVDA